MAPDLKRTMNGAQEVAGACRDEQIGEFEQLVGTGEQAEVPSAEPHLEQPTRNDGLATDRCSDLTREPATQPTAPQHCASSKVLRILLVDDHRDALRCLTLLLRSMGHTVVTADRGETALAAARESAPELMLCDIGLPDMDGYTVARTLRSDPQLRHLVLVAATGYGRAEDRRLVVEAGFDHHLVKPITKGDVEQLLTNLATQPPRQVSSGDSG